MPLGEDHSVNRRVEVEIEIENKLKVELKLPLICALFIFNDRRYVIIILISYANIMFLEMLG